MVYPNLGDIVSDVSTKYFLQDKLKIAYLRKSSSPS